MPQNHLLRTAAKLFDTPPEREAFVRSLTEPTPAPTAVVWIAERPTQPPFEVESQCHWQPDFVDRVGPEVRPGLFNEHEAGAFYCMDMSSVFAAVPLLQLPRNPSAVLDVCAAPGGKAIFSWRALAPEQLYVNEVIKKRLGPLHGNLTRCNIPAEILSSDASYLAEQYAESFPVVLVDAPCSGQSLLAKGKPSPGCFHPQTVNMNANRQRRIISNALKTVAPGGSLLYTTCTFAPKENEKLVEWVCKKNPEFETIPVPALEGYESTFTDRHCYRLWPQLGLGAGAFTALLTKS